MSISRKIKRKNIRYFANGYIIEYTKWKNEIYYRTKNNICDICEDMIVGTNHCSCNRYICNEHFNFNKNICNYCCNPDEVISHIWEFYKLEKVIKINEKSEKKELWKI